MTESITEMLTLECWCDDGEREPHCAYVDGVFRSAAAVERRMELKFESSAFIPRRSENIDQLTWTLVDRESGAETDFVYLTQRHRYYETGEEPEVD